MTAPSWALQRAIFAALSADAAVTALIGTRIYDGVPAAAPLPYLVLGESEERDASSDTPATRHALRLTIWSRGGGTREVKEIAGAVIAVLHGAALTLSGHRLIDLAFTSAEYGRQSNGTATRAVLRFSAFTEPF
ncbi:hypothetical protein FHS83_000951 [Rhizomicrobium palustre]|uniref:DUF3168 domain-containing protein n=1 Tax=Rhizomicrobium palustre TaxID=189966 RepID=A0A846MWA8_9PROT|nr:DUF3168 domain-containing protein [Rhizomicrobium palustre]NIK87633.1 hypothetical protein [Rhizomicrobium palustre]